MTSVNRQVTSREYKLLLNTERFRMRAAGTEAFWNLVTFLAGQQGLDVVSSDQDPDKKKNPQGEEKRRTVQYLDTPGLELQRQGAIVRLRYEAEEKKPYKVMLKYRSPDRYVAAGRDVSCTQDVDEKDRGKLKLADTTLKLALSHWYLQESEEDYPLVTEFSFDYDLPEEKRSKDELEQFSPELVRGANRLYDSLQSYTAWLSPAGLTKTRLAFESL